MWDMHSNPTKKSHWENDGDFCLQSQFCFDFDLHTRQADMQTHVHPRIRPTRTHSAYTQVIDEPAHTKRPTDQPTNAKPHNIVNFESLSYVLRYLTGFGWRFSCWHQLDGHYVIRAPIEVGWIMSAERWKGPNTTMCGVLSAIHTFMVCYATHMPVHNHAICRHMFVGGEKRKGLEEYVTYISIWWMWIVNHMNDEQKPYLSFLFFSFHFITSNRCLLCHWLNALCWYRDNFQ